MGHNRINAHPPGWNGGQFIQEDGYILIWSPDHPRKNSSGYVYEHRLVLEKQLNRFLEPEESTHHINGDKSDNRIENLMLFTNESNHRKFHNLGNTKQRT